MANSNKFRKTGRGNFGGSGREYNLSRQICIVSSSGTFVKRELTSKAHIISLLCIRTKRQVSKMRFFTMFITAVCFMFLIKLRWPKTKLKQVEARAKIACPSVPLSVGFNLTSVQSISGYFVTVVSVTAYMAAILNRFWIFRSGQLRR